MIERRHRIQDEFLTRSEDMHSFNHDVDWEQGNNPNLKSSRKLTADPRVTENAEHRNEVAGHGADRMKIGLEAGVGFGRDSAILRGSTEVLVNDIATEGKGTLNSPRKTDKSTEQERIRKDSARESILPPTPGQIEPASDLPETPFSRLQPLPQTNDADIGGPMLPPKETKSRHPLADTIRQPFIDENCMQDPVNETFYYDTWQKMAENNTKIYRTVFRCMPDSEVKSWKEYKEYTAYGEKFVEAQNQQTEAWKSQNTGAANNQSTVSMDTPARPDSEKTEKGTEPATNNSESRNRQSVDEEKAALKEAEDTTQQPNHSTNPSTTEAPETEVAPTTINENNNNRTGSGSVGYSGTLNTNVTQSGSTSRRRRTMTRGSRREFHASDGVIDLRHAEELLGLTRGHLIAFPYDW
jgi:phospholipase D1/2